ncbi:glycerophosphodiester phosphodiesterase [Ralstonia pickettii]|nr:glycerophosphodiester phosphodiesterase [Ralstonia pickettii]
MKKSVTLILLIAGAFFLLLIYVGAGSTIDKEEAIHSFKRDESSLLSSERFLIIAHRGASGYAPEHTIEAYKKGEELAADYIEIDLQMTSDGRLVAMHDMDLERTAGEEGEIREFSLEELKDFDVGTWFNQSNPELAEPVFAELNIPTLEEIFDTFGYGANYYIETKNPKYYPEMTAELIRILDKYNLLGESVQEGQIIIQSFSEESLRDIHEREPSLPLIQLISFDNEAKLSKRAIRNIKQYAVGIGVNHQAITKEFAERIRAAEMLLHAFTVNEKAEIEQLIEYGITGIFTDYPDILGQRTNP